MSAFTGRLTVTEICLGSDAWQLVSALAYEVGDLGSGRVIVVPPGFVSDGATIPWPVSIVLPRWGRWRRAAVVHDHLYALLAAGQPHDHAPDRRTADRIFREALLVSSVDAALAWVMFVAVRLFGGVALRRKGL